MHSWTTSQHRIAAINTPGGAVRLAPRALWPFLSTGFSQRFYVENIPSALTEAGEWVATDAEVRYLPTNAQVGRTLDAIMPVLDRLVVIRGGVGNGLPAHDLDFRHLVFAHTRHLTPDTGYLDTQAAVDVGAAVEADGAQNITVDNCGFVHTGGYGVWLRESVNDSVITNSSFSDLGAGGIKIGQPAGAGATSRNAANRNTIGDTGRLFPGAVGIWIGQGYDNTVDHNVIHDTTYTGISVGWTWGFGASASGRHRVRHNLLFNIGLAQLSDMGAIYTLGELAQTVISGNVIREVRVYPGYGPGPGLGGWGIYNDLGSSNVIVDGNVVVGTDSGGYHLHLGNANLVSRNLFAGGMHGEVRLSRATSSLAQAMLRDNILIPRASQPFDGLAKAPELSFADNRVSPALTVAKLDLSGCDGGCVNANVGVSTDSDPNVIRMTGLPQADRDRIIAIVAAAGPSNETGGTASASVRPNPPAFALAPPLPLNIDLSSARLGSLPWGMAFAPPDDANAIRVVAQRTAPSGRCIQFTERTGLVNPWDPHAFAELNHESGTSTADFWVLIDSQTDLIHEWRDNARPYRSGPILRITANGISVGGTIIAPAFTDQWMHIQVTSPLARPGAPWYLEVQYADGTTRKFQDLSQNLPQWQALNYMYFISNSIQESTFCLAGINVTNSNSQ